MNATVSAYDEEDALGDAHVLAGTLMAVTGAAMLVYMGYHVFVYYRKTGGLFATPDAKKSVS